MSSSLHFPVASALGCDPSGGRLIRGARECDVGDPLRFLQDGRTAIGKELCCVSQSRVSGPAIRIAHPAHSPVAVGAGGG